MHEESAHPRSRGENSSARKRPASARGSSPLTRGKRALRSVQGLQSRLIPAHAGKTVFMIVVVATDTAHPRSRGENPGATHEAWTKAGSSPLTRGKLFITIPSFPPPWLIPAHAGKTWRFCRPTCPSAAHPRSRGENKVSVVSSRARIGSSPLTRGKRPLAGVKGLQGRLIPAHAGKTYATRRDPRRPSAHPRSRGENRS